MMEGMNRADYLCSGSQRHLMVTTSHLETNDKKSAMVCIMFISVRLEYNIKLASISFHLANKGQ
jgi:hypothetical protein